MTSSTERHANAAPSCRHALAAVLVVLVALLAVAPASAAVYSVGPGATCTHNNLQAALDAAANNPGPDTVKIVRWDWTGIQASTQTDQDVDILGGFLACTSPEPDGRTTLNGAGGQARPVITLRGNGIFTLRNLEITGGDQAGDDDGGGIHFQGGGIVHIIDSLITGNSADEGGGIYAHGTTITAEVILDNTVVSFNTARSHGGGAVAQELEMTIRGAGSALMFNTAGGSGGGLLVRSGDRKSYAYISGGLFGVQGNSAARGGGIALQTGDDDEDAVVQIFSTTDVPVLIAGNQASVRGGGIDVQPHFDQAFSGGVTTARAVLRNVDIRDNTAPIGAAINLAHHNWGPFGSQAMGGGLYFNSTDPLHTLPPWAAPCPVGKPCGYIRDNHTGNITGAVVHLSEDGRFEASKIALEDNASGWLFYLSGEERTRLYLDNSLIAGNTVQHALIRDDQNQDDRTDLLALHYLTIAGNSIGANGVLSINEDLVFTRSLVDQPGKQVFATDVGSTGGGRDVVYVLVSHPLSPPAGTTVDALRFVDPANGDYLPRAGSRAVDYAPPMPVFDKDLHSRPRSIDLPVNGNELGVSDAGALERPTLQPLVLNADFDTDLNLWPGLGPQSNWDGSQNASGGSGSGSARVVYGVEPEAGVPSPRMAGRAQCIHLPGPGTYALNGWGRVLPAFTPMNGNRARLTWELRYDADRFGCDDGVPDLGGTHQIASTGTWTRPAGPALIEVPPSVWTRNTSLTIKLDVIGAPINPPSAWFDGITLETGYDDTIFANGFQP